MSAPHPSHAPFEAAVFSGGGCHCIWQAGFWSTAAPLLDLRPDVIAAVSGGAAFACAALSGEAERVIADFKRRVQANRRNVYWTNALRSAPVFPHEAIYRGVIADHLSEDGLRRVHEGPDLRILLARPPAWLGTRSGVLTAALAHLLDRREQRPRPRWSRRAGFQAELVSARSCRTPAELVELILQSSCIPLLFPVCRRGGRIVLDGSLLDHTPVRAVDSASSVLVLLSDRVPDARIPSIPGHTYVQPSRELPIARWDYTSPGLAQETFDLGRWDGERFARTQSAAAPAPTRTISAAS